jgi:hypothetical protein
VTREEALEEAGKSIFELSDVYIHSIRQKETQCPIRSCTASREAATSTSSG